MTAEIRAGTSGYSYKEWRGNFYPVDVHQDDWLSYYASQLPAVEINNTFYRMPRQHVVENWRDSVPDSFRFVIKASRRITHQHRLKDAEEPMGYLLHRAEILGSKLGSLLFQLPPYMRLDLDRLRSFQAVIPERLPVAFEFRHESWLEDEVEEALKERGHARVVTHDVGGKVEALMPNALVYLRLRAPAYTPAALRKWRERIAASGARQAFVFFKHEDAGGGPKMAAKFMALSTPQKAEPGRAAPKVRQADSGTRVMVEKAAPRKAAPRKAAPTKAAGRGRRTVKGKKP